MMNDRCFVSLDRRTVVSLLLVLVLFIRLRVQLSQLPSSYLPHLPAVYEERCQSDQNKPTIAPITTPATVPPDGDPESDDENDSVEVAEALTTFSVVVAEIETGLHRHPPTNPSASYTLAS